MPKWWFWFSGGSSSLSIRQLKIKLHFSLLLLEDIRISCFDLECTFRLIWQFSCSILISSLKIGMLFEIVLYISLYRHYLLFYWKFCFVSFRFFCNLFCLFSCTSAICLYHVLILPTVIILLTCFFSVITASCSFTNCSCLLRPFFNFFYFCGYEHNLWYGVFTRAYEK